MVIMFYSVGISRAMNEKHKSHFAFAVRELVEDKE